VSPPNLQRCPRLISVLGATEVVGPFLWGLGKITSSALASAFSLFDVLGWRRKWGSVLFWAQAVPPETIPSPRDVMEVRVRQSPR